MNRLHTAQSNASIKNDWSSRDHIDLNREFYTWRAEAVFLDVIGTKTLRPPFPPCYLQSPPPEDFTSPIG
jgi:hypothetical protein